MHVALAGEGIVEVRECRFGVAPLQLGQRHRDAPLVAAEAIVALGSLNGPRRGQRPARITKVHMGRRAEHGGHARNTHRERLRTRLFEQPVRFPYVTVGDERAYERHERLRLPVLVADGHEIVVGVPCEHDRRIDLARPQVQIGEQHEHHRHAPAVAAFKGFLAHDLGDGAGFVEPALLETDPRQEPERPTRTTRVAELAER